MVDEAKRDDEDTEARELHARARVGTGLRGKYQLDRLLGVGGMAAVYSATHRNGKEVAIKILHPHLCVRPDITSRFLREGHAANKVKHAGAVSVLDDDLSEDGSPFLVMELLQGPTVQELWELRDGSIHPGWVVAILMQLLDVMAAAHEAGVIHRDLKPENLVLTASGELKVLDFGIARFREATGHTTTKGTLMGTPAFMAPEQALAKTRDIDERTDLWAIGSIAYALLAGDVVHPGSTAHDTLIRAATRPAPPLATRVNGVPAPIAAVIDRSLAWKREDRWDSAVTMGEALAEAATRVYGVVPGSNVLAGLTRSSIPPAPSTSVVRSAFMFAATVAGASASRSRAEGGRASEALTLAPIARLMAVRRSLSSRVSVKQGRAMAVAGIALGCVLLTAFARNLRAEPSPVATIVDAPESTDDLRVMDSAARPTFSGGSLRDDRLAGADEAAPVVPAVPRAVSRKESPRSPAKATASLSGGSRAGASPAADTQSRCVVPYVRDPKTGLKVWKATCL